MKTDLTFKAVRELAETYIPLISSWGGNMTEIWGPAHEIGHLLIAKPAQIHQRDFGLGPAGGKTTFKQKVYEVAASFIHTWILVACGKNGIHQAIVTWGDDIPDFMEAKRWVDLKPYADALIAKRGITPESVQSLASLEKACQWARRCG